MKETDFENLEFGPRNFCLGVFYFFSGEHMNVIYVSISLHSYLCSLKQYFSIGHYRLWGQTVGIAPSTQSFILNPWGLSCSNTSPSYSVFKSHLVTEHRFMCPTHGEAKKPKTLEFGAEKGLLEAHARRRVACAPKLPNPWKGFSKALLKAR